VILVLRSCNKQLDNYFRPQTQKVLHGRKKLVSNRGAGTIYTVAPWGVLSKISDRNRKRSNERHHGPLFNCSAEDNNRES
jgi:hypothetical protein